jgi:hypothetical protein
MQFSIFEGAALFVLRLTFVAEGVENGMLRSQKLI